ncbi:unnamed protein product [Spirodela intermedia]|uniref:Uncharacterized protein n=1 Tax=Spirodela intermedia TaxID=51605 RepID=A0A7I8JYV8_SPIIN|nr:unnamed protein product [Spirodela intermedia]
MANFFWLEGESSAGFSVSMRNAVDYIHGATHGRPKHVDKDVWDVAMERGDQKITESCIPLWEGRSDWGA